MVLEPRENVVERSTGVVHKVAGVQADFGGQRFLGEELRDNERWATVVELDSERAVVVVAGKQILPPKLVMSSRCFSAQASFAYTSLIASLPWLMPWRLKPVICEAAVASERDPCSGSLLLSAPSDSVR